MAFGMMTNTIRELFKRDEYSDGINKGTWYLPLLRDWWRQLDAAMNVGPRLQWGSLNPISAARRILSDLSNEAL